MAGCRSGRATFSDELLTMLATLNANLRGVRDHAILAAGLDLALCTHQPLFLGRYQRDLGEITLGRS
jgi:hypothetical protein